MKINNLFKSFDKKIIFNNASFEFEDGKITYIMGGSGIGKTTLLRIISGLDASYSGKIIKNGELAYVFQEPRLFPTLNLEENIKIASESSKFDIDNLLEIVELKDFKNFMPSELSGGMKSRVSLVRAIYKDADIYIMDEPFSNLDEDLKKRIIPKIFELLKEKTILIVSHDPKEAEKYSDNIIYLK